MLRSVSKQSGESVESVLVKKKKKKKNVTTEGFAENAENRGMRDVCDAGRYPAVSWAMAFVLLMVVHQSVTHARSHSHYCIVSCYNVSLYRATSRLQCRRTRWAVADELIHRASLLSSPNWNGSICASDNIHVRLHCESKICTLLGFSEEFSPNGWEF